MKPFFVAGTSMWPVLKTGDLVFTKPKSHLEIGDLVVRVINGTPTAHRFLAGGLTKGDRMSAGDDPADFGFSGDVVIGLIPRTKTSVGGLFSTTNLTASAIGLARWQAFLSYCQFKCKLRLFKLVFLACLVTNGLLLRGLYHLKLQGGVNVMHDS